MPSTLPVAPGAWTVIAKMLLALLLLAGCDPDRGALSIVVDRAACAPGCAIARYQLSVLQQAAGGQGV